MPYSKLHAIRNKPTRGRVNDFMSLAFIEFAYNYYINLGKILNNIKLTELNLVD